MTSFNSKRPSEFALIAELFAPLAKDVPGALSLTDDAALITPPQGHELIITTDTLVEGIHFLASDPPSSIAKKALRVNLSDLAAKGADAIGYLLALSLPNTVDMNWLRAFADGLVEDQRLFDVSLYGGDTTSTTGPVSITITAFGFVPRGMMIQRGGAKPGDLVFVSGTVGDAGAGLDVLKTNMDGHAYLKDRYREPTPRMKFGRALRGVASAALDVSDGLIGDLQHIVDVSKARMEIDAARIPLSPELRALWGNDCVVRAATCGDDYEIAFTAPESSLRAVQDAARSSGTQVSAIGCVVHGEGVALLDKNAREIPVLRTGYTHF